MTKATATHILTVKGLSKTFGRTEILKDVKLSVGLGEIYAIIGPNGAGKTTLFNLLTGIVKKDEGIVTYYLDKGDNLNPDTECTCQDISQLKSHQISRLGIGRTFQGNRIFSNMTVLDNVMFAKLLLEIEDPLSILRVSYKKLIKKLKNSHNKAYYDDRSSGFRDLETFLKQEAGYWLDFVGLKKMAGKKAEELSYGQQKLLSIARLLMADCRLFLFDEPTAGVNQEYAVRIAELFKTIVEKKNRTILFIEHDMNFIQAMNCKCLYLERGRCPWPFYELEVIMKNSDIKRTFMGM